MRFDASVREAHVVDAKRFERRAIDRILREKLERLIVTGAELRVDCREIGRGLREGGRIKLRLLRVGRASS